MPAFSISTTTPNRTPWLRKGLLAAPVPYAQQPLYLRRFTVYICIPLYPEGDPQSVAMQAVLCWQSRTLQMMYSKVAEALARWGPADAHPCHYLNVYCLAKREQCPVRVDLSMVRNPRQQQLIQVMLCYPWPRPTFQ